MVKMMTYSEANQVLGSSLTPNNKCLCKSIAIASGADESLLTSYNSNRLVPASAVQPAQHDVVEQFFVDDNGNLVKELTKIVSIIATEAIYKTVVTVNGEIYKPEQIEFAKFPYNDYYKDTDKWTDPDEMYSWGQSSPLEAEYDSETGIFTHTVKFREQSIGDHIECSTKNVVRYPEGGLWEDLDISITFRRDTDPSPLVNPNTINVLYSDVAKHTVNVLMSSRWDISPKQGVFTMLESSDFREADDSYYQYGEGSFTIQATSENNTGQDRTDTYSIVDRDENTVILTFTQTKDSFLYYTIRFLDDDGTVLSTQSVEEGTMPTAPSDPTKEDYNFSGWSPTVAVATQNQDYTATYTQKPYQVLFRDDSQFGGTLLSEHYYNEGETPVAPEVPEHEGYTHDGWIPAVVNVSANATYYATYQGEQPTEYTIRFLGYDGTVLKTQQCESGTTPTAPLAPFRPGYTFVGWTPSVGPATQDQDYTATYVEDSSTAKVNVQITNSTGQVVHVNDIVSVAGSRESEFWFDNVQINNGSTYTKNDFDYYDEGNTINTVYAEYSKGSSGTYQRVEIPSADWYCTMGTELSDGDTLYVTLRS